jgi:hypothetical protein
MTSDELARLCFAARPVLWAIAIIVILWAASLFFPKTLGPTPGSNTADGN